jgi:hypothetical protein
MIDDPQNMTCEEFQARMPELIKEGVDTSTHPHVLSCDLCRALLADLETIAEAARQLFPIVDPPDHLWNKIESSIKEQESGAQHT